MKLVTLFSFLTLFTVHGSSLVFEKDVIEVTASIDKETVKGDFRFTNKGSETVTIRAADAGCSCMEVQVSKKKLTYAPGESGTLRGIFKLDSAQGLVEKEILVWLQGDPDKAPSSKVLLKVNIPVTVALIPKTLQWSTGGDVEPKTMRVEMNHSSPIHVKSIKSTSKSFSTELIEVEKGKVYEIKVTPLNNKKPGLGMLTIETDFRIKKHRVHQGYAVMKKGS